jgi:hypothetical protein
MVFKRSRQGGNILEHAAYRIAQQMNVSMTSIPESKQLA